MNIESGQRLLHYRLIEKIGEGGMGVVWKAEDTTLDREVAIKILPEAFAADPARLERFEREAKLLASLNHPRIAAIYGLHAADAIHFLAMEFVVGEDLAARLVRGPLPLDEALATARQVAEALEAAHERGVIHRDLKPANIKLTPDGEVKVLDFGLAKALDLATASGPADFAASPTLTSAGTLAGVILGTAAYMSPEQARAKPLDRRTDLWSFGCVLYEMLTGRQAFSGETVTDILSAVISRDPDPELLPANLPPSLRRLLDRCLAKDVRVRPGDAASARLDLDDATREMAAPARGTAGAIGSTGGTEAAVTSPARRILPWVIAAAPMIVLLAVWLAGGLGNSGGSAGSGAPAVIAIEALTDRLGPEFEPALSPDGRSLAYVALDGDDLDIFLVRVGGENPINLTADHDGWDAAPAFSPDGESIAFASEREGSGLFVMGATGESPRRVAEEGTHPTWSPDGTKLAAATEQVWNPYSRTTRSRIFVVDLATGETRDLPVVDDGVGPNWSPDGARIAYWNEIEGQRDLWTITVDGGENIRVTEDVDTDWEPMWAEGGRALYFHSDRGGSADLWRIPFDPQTGAATGEPTPLTIGVTPIWESSLSADGTRLVGAMRASTAVIRSYPFDADRFSVTGEPSTVLQVGTKLVQPNLSFDGRAIAFRTTRPREIVTTLDLETGVRRRLTDDQFRNRGPAWSPDGEWIAMYSNRGGAYQIWLMRREGTELHRIYAPSSSDPAWSPDGERVAMTVDVGARWDSTVILTRDPDATEDHAPWITVGEPIESFSVNCWSPNGRWLAGTAGYPGVMVVHDLESGTLIEHDDPPPDNDTDLIPSWMPDGDRLLYWDTRSGRLTAWNVATGERRSVQGVIEAPGSPMVTPDGRTLYMLEQPVDGEIWMLTLK